MIGAAQAFSEDNIEPYKLSAFDEFTPYIQAVKDQLGDQTFKSLLYEGRKMSIDQAIAIAIEIKRSESAYCDLHLRD